MNHQPSRKHAATQAGNSLLEYALPLAVFFLLGGILLILGDVPDRLQVFYNDTMHAEQNGSSTEVPTLGTIKAPPGSEVLGETQPGVEQVCFTNGRCLNITLVGVPGAATETAGGIGGEETKAFSSTLAQLAKLLEEAGAENGIVDLVTRLANSGHDLGDSIIDLEAACPGGACGFNRDSFQGALDGATISKNDFYSVRDQFNAFMAANPNALDAMPEAKAIIDANVTEISGIAGKFDVNASSKLVTEDAGTQSTLTNTFANANGVEPITTFKDANGNSMSAGSITSDYKAGETTCTGISCTTTMTTETNQFQGFYLNGAGDGDIAHQDSNSICGQGGAAACYRRQDGDGEWSVISPSGRFDN